MIDWENFEKHKKIIDSYNKKITFDNYQIVMSEIYKYIKEVTNDLYIDGQMIGGYDLLKSRVYNAEDRVAGFQKILGDPILINMNDKLNEDDFLNYLIYNTRKYLIENQLFYNSKETMVDFNQLYLANFCTKAALYVFKLCKFNSIEAHIITIYPGYDSLAKLFDGFKCHSATVIKYNNKYYLVDLTYSQFFYAKKNNLDRLGVVNLDGCPAGIFMMNSEKAKDIAITLINEGYIELDEGIFKTYLDGFTMSFRNGLYYENTNDFSYVTQYTIDDYINFFQGKDNQIKYEGKENLGFQRKPLKNAQMIFRR